MNRLRFRALKNNKRRRRRIDQVLFIWVGGGGGVQDLKSEVGRGIGSRRRVLGGKGGVM